MLFMATYVFSLWYSQFLNLVSIKYLFDQEDRVGGREGVGRGGYMLIYCNIVGTINSKYFF